MHSCKETDETEQQGDRSLGYYTWWLKSSAIEHTGPSRGQQRM